MKIYTILIADDYPENLQIIAEALQESDLKHKIIRAVNGRVLCELAEKRIPDLIITDWEMPVMNGIDAIKYLKSIKSTKDIPIIICTGIMTTSQNLKMALDSGAVDFIRKPIDPIELQARVHSMLKLSDSYHTIKEQNAVLENQKEEIIAQKDEIENQHAVIQKKNYLISASIQYAKNIQQAILPPTCMMDKIGDSFVLCLPKNIVSGDFYWIAEQTEKISEDEINSDKAFVNSLGIYQFLAVVDCTGHGVPGAFMSMIANTLLNEIVTGMKVQSPAQILRLLQKKVISTLHQTDSNNDDGMDIGICRFEKKGNDTIITYAGAKHSLYHFSDTDKSMKVIRGSRTSIGGQMFEKNSNFSDTSFHAKPNDSLFMFTDGAICQLNNEGIKLGTTNFLKTIAKNIDLPLDIQKSEIESLYTNTQQLDDITVVGLRLK
jgi:CheY-like chemotaxis protein